MFSLFTSQRKTQTEGKDRGERDIEDFPTPNSFPKRHSSKGWARPKPGDSNSTQNSHRSRFFCAAIFLCLRWSVLLSFLVFLRVRCMHKGKEKEKERSRGQPHPLIPICLKQPRMGWVVFQSQELDLSFGQQEPNSLSHHLVHLTA